MTRLTNGMRETILENLIKHKYDAIKPVMMKERAGIALAIYNRVYNPKVRAKMDELPDGWLQTHNDIMIRFETENMRFAFNGYHSNYTNHVLRYIYDCNVASITKKFPHSDLKGSTLAVINKSNDELGLRIYEHIKLETQYCTEIRNLKKTLENTLASFTTTEKLVEAWSEVKEFVPGPVVTATNLPAIPVADLNKSLGLPVNV